MGLWDYTGIGILLAILFAAVVFLFIAFIAFMVYVIRENDSSRQLLRQKAYAAMTAAIGFFLLNALVFILYLELNQNISRETKKSAEPLMFWGWLPVNLIAYLSIAAIIRKIKSNKI